MGTDARKLAEDMHSKRCKTCQGEKSIDTCSDGQTFKAYAVRRLERRAKAIVGQFVKGKPPEVTKTERRMEMGSKAKDLRNELDHYIQSLIEDNLTLDQVAELYNKMMALATINRKFKKSVCKK